MARKADVDILVQDEERLLHITLNRPEKRNALNAAMCSGIVQAVRSAQGREDIGAILISAAGRVFCAGMDLDEASASGEDRLGGIHEELFSLGSTSLKPIVTAVNGPALGGGLGLVAQAHVVIAGPGASFSLPEIRIGLWPFLIHRAVEAALGVRRTLELSLTARVFDAGEGLAWGLVHRVHDETELPERAMEVARELARSSPSAIRAGMRHFHESRGKSWEEAGEVARRLRGEVMAGGDFEEGYRAFKEKREPRWPTMPQQFYQREHEKK